MTLMLSDVVMLDMGGVTLVFALREQGWEIPIILMSGHPLDEEADVLRSVNVFAWLSKLCSLETLAHTLAETFRRGLCPPFENAWRLDERCDAGKISINRREECILGDWHVR